MGANIWIIRFINSRSCSRFHRRVYYTKFPVISQLKGYVEVLPQTLVFSLLVFYWYEKPRKLWNVLSIILVIIIIILSALGLMASKQLISLIGKLSY